MHDIRRAVRRKPPDSDCHYRAAYAAPLANSWHAGCDSFPYRALGPAAGAHRGFSGVKESAMSAKSKLKQAGHSASEAATKAGHKMSEGAEKAGDWAKEKAHEMGHRADEAAQKAAHRADEGKDTCGTDDCGRL